MSSVVLTKKFSDTTFLAEVNGDTVVLKQILPEEKQIYLKLLNARNECIAAIYGFVDYEGKTYVAREYVEGISVADFREKYGRPSDKTIISIGEDICKGLSLVHSLGIVHRDINPDNVLIDNAGRAKIIDFGISRFTKENAPKDTQILGTVGYAAPEQFGFHQTSAKADIYSVGVLVNYLCEGCLPNEKLTGGRFKSTVLKCTRMDDNKRFNNVDEVAYALRHRGKSRMIISLIPGLRSDKQGFKTGAAIYYVSMLFVAVLAFFKESNYVSGIRESLSIVFNFLVPAGTIFDFGYFMTKFSEKHNFGKGFAIFLRVITTVISIYIASLLTVKLV